MNTEETHPLGQPQPQAHTESQPFTQPTPQPTVQASTAQTSTAQTPAVAQSPTRLTPRSGPIVAGTLVLVFCAYVVVQTMGGTIDATTWIIATILGLGVLLLAVGLAVLLRGSRDRS